MLAEQSNNRVRFSLEEFYAQRIQTLKTLRLRAALVQNRSFILSILGEPRASELIEGLLETTLRASEGWWEELKHNENFALQLVRLLHDHPNPYRAAYENERAKAINRLTREFLSEFATEKGEIDWEKLVRFHSGKETNSRPQ
ncbi:MAG TPA: hypothetical protein VFB21_12855 [Chthonomonadaceae bacterium]|nr:hypothetical protein [Chthonomonadaceae bacterium]